MKRSVFAWLVLLTVFAVAPLRAQGVQLLGFADIDYRTTEQPGAEGFSYGQLTGHLAAGLSPRLSFFNELTVTPVTDGFRVAIERLVLRYDFADEFKLSAGRYHTPVNYWNVAYHHGLWLQTTITRPEQIRFGTPLIPVHFVGLLAEGSLPRNALGPTYYAGVGNGRHTNLAHGGDAGDANPHHAWMLGLSLRPAALYGLDVGAALYRDRIAAAHHGMEDASAIDEHILSAHLAWQKETPEVIAEYTRILHKPNGEARSNTDAYYVQAAYRLPDRLRALKPYVRYERIDVPEGAPVFGSLSLGYTGWTGGVRYDFSELAALKGEYRRERSGEGSWFNGLYVQVSFTFPGAFMQP